MAGAFSLFLGLLGLGAAGAVSAGQNAKIKKADYQYGEEHGLHGTSEVLQMRERVRKEWWSICGKTYNACERPASSYGNLSRTPWCYLKKRWFIDHLNKKGIPYPCYGLIGHGLAVFAGEEVLVASRVFLQVAIPECAILDKLLGECG